MLSYILIAAVIPALMLGYPIVQCPGGLPSPIEFRIDGCPSSPCNVTRGTVITSEAVIVANANSATLTLAMDLTAFGETIEYPVPAPIANVCNHLVGRGCPVTVGETVIHASSTPIIVDFGGGIPVVLRSRIYNADGSVMSCSLINARVY